MMMTLKVLQYNSRGVKIGLVSNTTQNLSIKGHWCKPVAGSEKLAIEACKLQSTKRVDPRFTSWITSYHRQEVTRRRRALMNPTSTTRNGAMILQRWKWSHDIVFRVAVMKEWSIATGETQAGLVNYLIDFSWTYRRHWNGLVALTPKMDGMTDQW